jgi:flavin reductase (DIM6/NTAB) family NADH-FMN oxidoreductase RutF
VNSAAQAALDELLAGLDSPMYVVTAAADDERAGCLVGFATQASIDPVRFLVMISTANETWEIARRSEVLVLHHLQVGNHELATLFGEQSGDWTDKFARCEWSPGPAGVPVLAGVRGWVAGRILDRYDVGDHVAHLIEPIDAAIGTRGEALTYLAVRDLDAGHPA